MSFAFTRYLQRNSLYETMKVENAIWHENDSKQVIFQKNILSHCEKKIASEIGSNRKVVHALPSRQKLKGFFKVAKLNFYILSYMLFSLDWPVTENQTLNIKCLLPFLMKKSAVNIGDM